MDHIYGLHWTAGKVKDKTSFQSFKSSIRRINFVDIIDRFYCYATKEEAKEMNVIKD